MIQYTVWNKRTHQEADGEKVRELIKSGKLFFNGYLEDKGRNTVWVDLIAPGFELREKDE